MAVPINLNDDANDHTSGADNDTINGNGGNDTIHGGDGHDSILGGTGIDWLFGDGGNDWLDAGTSLPGSAIRETLDGGEGNDTLRAGGSYVAMLGGAGDDDLQGTFMGLVEGGAGADHLTGTGGYVGTTLSYETSTSGVSINLKTNQASGGHAAGDTISGFANIDGSAWGDTLTGSEGANALDGRDGADSLSGLGGIDYLEGGAGNDTLNGGADDDTLIGGAGADRLVGGGGIDVADYRSSFVAVSVNLKTGTATGGEAQGDTFSGIENVVGTTGNDKLTGSNAANNLNGASGADTLDGGKGNDYLFGGDSAYSGTPSADKLRGGLGDDTLYGDPGGDILDGGDGNDTAYMAGQGDMQINLATGKGKGGMAEGDTYISIENATGGYDNDLLTGDSKANRLGGSLGNDTVKGGSGNDTLEGSLGQDNLNGGAGDDSLSGGDGSDKLKGGGGKDFFEFEGILGATNIDTIADFSVRDDTVHLENYYFTALLKEGGLAKGAFAANNTGLAKDASDRIIYEKDTGKLFYDADGKGGADAIQFGLVTGRPTLTHEDFIIA